MRSSRGRGERRGDEAYANASDPARVPTMAVPDDGKLTSLAELLQDGSERRLVQQLDLLAEPVRDLRGERREAARVDAGLGVGKLGQGLQLIDLLPGEIEIGRHLLHEARLRL